MSAERTKPKAVAINPAEMYSLPGFYLASGLGRRSIRKAEQRGVELKTLRVGRRKYVRGSDAIRFIEEAAESEA